MSFLGAFAGAVGGAARGMTPALGDVMAQRQQQGRYEAGLALDKSQFDERMVLERAQLERQREQGEYERAMDRRDMADQRERTRIARMNAETAQVRAQTDAQSERMRTRTNPVRENIDARLQRAQDALDDFDASDSEEVLNRKARLRGFRNHQDAVNVYRSSGRLSVPSPYQYEPGGLTGVGPNSVGAPPQASPMSADPEAQNILSIWEQIKAERARGN